MSETSPSEQSNPGTPINSGNLFSARLNISAVLVMATIVFGLVKLSAFLPQSYYFTLTSLVGGDRASPFIINTPILLTNEELCERAAAKGMTIERLCSYREDEDDDGSIAPDGASRPQPQSIEPSSIAKERTVDAPPTVDVNKSPPPPGEGQEQNDKNVDTVSKKSSSPPASSGKSEDEKKIEKAQEIVRQIRQERRESARVKELQSNASQGKSIIALLLRCLIPIVAGGLVASLYRADLSGEVGAGAVLAVVALFWPVAYLWQDLQIGDDWADKQNLFMVLYFCYAALFYFLGRLGSQLGFAYIAMRGSRSFSLDYKRMIESFIPGLIAGICVQFVVHLLLK